MEGGSVKFRQAKKIVDGAMRFEIEARDLVVVMTQLFGEDQQLTWHRSERKAWQVYERHARRGKK